MAGINIDRGDQLVCGEPLYCPGRGLAATSSRLRKIGMNDAVIKNRRFAE